MRIYKFDGVIGHKINIKLIRNSLTTGNFPRLVLLYGQPGTGKSTCAEIIGLSLTCDNPKDGEPCLECSNCKKNLDHLQKGSTSANLCQKDLGRYNSTGSVEEMLKEIFMLKSISDKNVYIFEEIHSLKESEQRALLQEFDRIQEDTWIVMTTTEFYKVIEPLRSRAMSFAFNRLTKEECRVIALNTCKKLDINLPLNMIDEVIIKARNTPRDITNLVSFVGGVKGVTEEDIKAFLGVVDVSVYIGLFKNMKEDMFTYVEYVENLTKEQNIKTILHGLKNFIKELAFRMKANISEEISRKQSNMLVNILSYEKLHEVSKFLLNFKVKEDEDDFILGMIVLRGIVTGQKPSKILAQASDQARTQKDNITIQQLSEKQTSDISIKRISRDSLSTLKESSQFRGDNS